MILYLVFLYKGQYKYEKIEILYFSSFIDFKKIILFLTWVDSALNGLNKKCKPINIYYNSKIFL